ncbi:transposase [Haloferula sargassicola]|uniref:Transposase IS200-like domain-containing protein n=1 Tax=Haloferula sargassicola TaxID=490096 RepID=A0ABP9UZP8_9BACT
MPDWSAFHFFRRGADLQRSLNRLPHWQQEQGCLFVTLRLADSLPARLLEKWRNERETWTRFHLPPWNQETQHEYHRRFSMQIEHWLDAGYGGCAMKDRCVSGIVRDVFLHFDGDRYLQHAFVIMPNHAHLLFSLGHGHDLGQVVGSWKSVSAKRIHRHTGGSGAFWQKDYHDRLVRGPEHFRRVARYLRKNHEESKTALLWEAPWLQEWLDRGGGH